ALREGKAGTLGEITVYGQKLDGEFEKIGSLSNFNLFPEIDRREGTIVLEKLPEANTIRIIYEYFETGEVYDEISLNL
ncbi:MAG: hypothetical protein AAF551_15675, partial [Bacteroidota bacterium]